MNARGYFYTEESEDGVLIEAFEDINEEIIEEIVQQIQRDSDQLLHEIKRLEKHIMNYHLMQPITRSYPKEEQK